MYDSAVLSYSLRTWGLPALSAPLRRVHVFFFSFECLPFVAPHVSYHTPYTHGVCASKPESRKRYLSFDVRALTLTPPLSLLGSCFTHTADDEPRAWANTVLVVGFARTGKGETAVPLVSDFCSSRPIAPSLASPVEAALLVLLPPSCRSIALPS